MAKQKVGLHKQVSQIFDGVPIPKESGPQKPAKTPVSSRLDFLRPTRRESTPTSSFRPPLRLPRQVGGSGEDRNEGRHETTAAHEAIASPLVDSA